MSLGISPVLKIASIQPGNLADSTSLRFVVELRNRARLLIDELQ